MLPGGGVWGKRKPRARRLGWVRGDARGIMWARQEGLRHPHPHPHPHAVVRCPSSSSSVSCSGKGPPPAVSLLPRCTRGGCHFCFCPSFPRRPLPAAHSCCGAAGVASRCARAHLAGLPAAWPPLAPRPSRAWPGPCRSRLHSGQGVPVPFQLNFSHGPLHSFFFSFFE